MNYTMMNEEMTRATLDDVKTETRRVIIDVFNSAKYT